MSKINKSPLRHESLEKRKMIKRCKCAHPILSVQFCWHVLNDSQHARLKEINLGNDDHMQIFEVNEEGRRKPTSAEGSQCAKQCPKLLVCTNLETGEINEWSISLFYVNLTAISMLKIRVLIGACKPRTGEAETENFWEITDLSILAYCVSYRPVRDPVSANTVEANEMAEWIRYLLPSLTT